MENLIIKKFKCELEIENWVHDHTMENIKSEDEKTEEVKRHKDAVLSITQLYEMRLDCLESLEGLEKTLER